MLKLSVKGMGLAIAVTWAFANLVAGWTAMFGWGGKYVDVMSSIYIGYAPTWVGGLIGGAWAFFDGMICGILFAFVYNKVAKSA